MSRLVGAVFVALLSSVYTLGMPRAASADPAPTVPVPTNLSMALPGSAASLSAGSWISSGRITLRFSVDADSSSVSPQVEIQPVGTPFAGVPNISGSAVKKSGQVSLTAPGLLDGKGYHWQARVQDATGSDSAWVPFASAEATGPDFAIDRDAPTRPAIQSPSDPNPNLWYHNRVVQLRWSSQDKLSGIKGYSYTLLRSPHVIPPGSITTHTNLLLGTLADGTWFLALRSVDRAGNWSPTATFRLQLDRQTPRLTWMGPSKITFNPYRGPITVQFRVSKDASVHGGLYRVGSKVPTATYSFGTLHAGQVVRLTWNGKDKKGNPVTRGYYFFSFQAVDRARNAAHWNLGGITVAPQKPQVVVGGVTLYPGDGKRIVVVLSRETLYAYDGNHLVLQTYVTTGNPSLPTPVGSYSVMAKYSPYEFISPWPPGSPYWYPPSLSHYAMLFRDGGYFLHDAPWRSAFGPGTNGPGQPGSNYGGTHGCVNIPPSAMLFLWSWTPVGTQVDVVP